MNTLRMTAEQAAAHQARVKSARVVKLADMGAPVDDSDLPALAPAKPEPARELMPTPDAKPSKYRNQPTWVEGVRFASKAEAEKWIELRYSERAGVIKNLKRQVTYRLRIGAIEITKYRSDMEFDDCYGRHHVIDVKGHKESGAYRMFQIKQRLMKALLNIDVEEA